MFQPQSQRHPFVSAKAIGGSKTANQGCEVNKDFDKWFSDDSYIRIADGWLNATREGASIVLSEKSEYRFQIFSRLKGGKDSRYRPGLYVSCRKGRGCMATLSTIRLTHMA